ncbi:MAG TPA: TonB-dependent receptor [Bacteroidales bacterium]|nr:TonB-dependent receptor [Bacteroidales bacterium]
MQITKVQRIALFMLSMVLSLGFAFAQERTITGKVTIEGEGPAPGVNVLLKGTMNGTITDMNGAYSIKVPGPDAVLQFSFIGYLTEEVTVGAQSAIDVVLKQDIVSLQEVVVTGYSTQRKRDITGAVGVVETSKLTAIPTGNVTSQLQGRTSGVTVTGSGQPGEAAKVRIRGISSFEGNDPLYIVDGVPTTDITTLNPNDVETMTVLKDAGSASVYGSRASNGVIVVTTKKGGQGIKVNYDMYVGSQLPGKGPTSGFVTTEGYADLQWLVYKNDKLNGTVDGPDDDNIPDFEVHPLYGSSANAAPTLPSWAAHTDWYDVITDPAPIQNHDISLSGGNDKARFFGSFGYFDRGGIILRTYEKRYSGRFNSEWTFLNDRVKVGENFTLAMTRSHQVTNLGEGSPIQMASYRTQPIIPAVITQEIAGSSHTFKVGEYGGTGIAPRLGNSTNSLADLNRDKDDMNLNLRMIASTYLDVKLLEGLNFRSTVGGTYATYYYTDYGFATYERAENVGTASMSEGAGVGGDWFWSNTLNLNKTFGQHTINAVLGYEALETGLGRDVSGNRAGYFSDKLSFRTLNNGQKIQNANSNYYTPRALLSQFIKADYQFMDKYLLSATVRRDGSSVFGQDDKYGIFPSVSAGWRIGEEAFLDGLPWLSELKIRGSYGTMGNQIPVQPQNQYALYGGGAGSSYYDLDGTGTSSVEGFRATTIANPNAKWETNVSTNIGFEGGLFDNKLTLVFDWYSRTSKDLLFQPEVPGTVGSATAPYINVGQMKNSGVDMEVGYKNNFGDLGFNANLTFTTFKNEIIKVDNSTPFFESGGSRIGNLVRNMEGEAVSSFFGYKVIGLFQSDADVANSPTQDGAAPGFMKFQNVNQGDAALDSKIDPGDRQVIGNPNPDFTYGLNIGLNYKNLDLSAFFYGSYGNDIYNWNKWWTDFWPSFQGQKSEDLLTKSWTPDRTNTDVPKASNTSNFSTNTQSTSYYIEDGSYLRLKNLTIGYTIPESIVNKVKIKNLRVYVQAVNLFTLTKYTGLDPELGGGDTAFGIDYGNYPTVRQFNVGLNLGL